MVGLKSYKDHHCINFISPAFAHFVIKFMNLLEAFLPRIPIHWHGSIVRITGVPWFLCWERLPSEVSGSKGTASNESNTGKHLVGRIASCLDPIRAVLTLQIR